ncbi:hypothetical protein BASA50_004667 [Batrachochytrium salamandrivorans]|uniref:SAP domain-containing protein n=1 Tax=Batrachochytrium salamandrivorans TaxID=1357716 RepID=A0ABQ8FEX5_9FUNG|nr:hypothetical protein BASA50_004667 [Batrachochytrium salamandrivorans]
MLLQALFTNPDPSPYNLRTCISRLSSLQRNKLRALGRSLGISHLRDRVEVDGLLKNYLNPHPSLLHDDGTISLDTISQRMLKDVPIDRFHAVVALLEISQWRNRSIVIADLVQHVVNSPRALTGNILVTLGLSTDDSIPFWGTPSPSFIVKITDRFQSLTDWELRRMCSSVNVSSSKGHSELVNELVCLLRARCEFVTNNRTLDLSKAIQASILDNQSLNINSLHTLNTAQTKVLCDACGIARKLTKEELVRLIRHHLTHVAPDMLIDGVISLAALSQPVVIQSAITE